MHVRGLQMYIQRSLVPGSISGSGSANAQNCGSEQAKTKFASNPLHCLAVRGVLFFTQHRCNPTVESGGNRGHTTRCRQHKWAEGGLLYLEDPFFIVSSFLILMLAVGGRNGSGTVRLGAGAKYPYIKECPFEPTTLYTTS